MAIPLRIAAALCLLAIIIVAYVVAGPWEGPAWEGVSWHAVWGGSRGRLESLVSGHPAWTLAIIFVLHVLLATTGLPGASVLMLLTGAVYGVWFGTFIALTACTIGATLTLVASRFWLRPLVVSRWGERLARVDERLRREGVRYLLSLRLLPVVPFFLVNIAAGVSAIRVWTFFWASYLGMLAGTVIYVNAGTELSGVEKPGDILTPSTVIALTALALLPLLPHLSRGLTSWHRHP